MLSYLAESFFEESPVLAYPITALLLFLVVFLVISYRTFRRDPAEMERLARLPLGDAAPDAGDTTRGTEP